MTTKKSEPLAAVRAVTVEAWRCPRHGVVCQIDDQYPSFTRRLVAEHRAEQHCVEIYDKVQQTVEALTLTDALILKAVLSVPAAMHKFEDAAVRLREQLGLTDQVAKISVAKLMLVEMAQQSAKLAADRAKGSERL